jgi:hypothetical protein
MEVSSATEPDKAKIEAIDRDIWRAMAHATNKIRKIYTSSFSPQIKQGQLRRRFYKLHLFMLINKLDLRTQLESLIQELDKELPASSNLDKGCQLLRDSQKNVREDKDKAAMSRREFSKLKRLRKCI